MFHFRDNHWGELRIRTTCLVHKQIGVIQLSKLPPAGGQNMHCSHETQIVGSALPTHPPAPSNTKEASPQMMALLRTLGSSPLIEDQTVVERAVWVRCSLCFADRTCSVGTMLIINFTRGCYSEITVLCDVISAVAEFMVRVLHSMSAIRISDVV